MEIMDMRPKKLKNVLRNIFKCDMRVVQTKVIHSTTSKYSWSCEFHATPSRKHQRATDSGQAKILRPQWCGCCSSSYTGRSLKRVYISWCLSTHGDSF
jgi:hypothetical protein